MEYSIEIKKTKSIEGADFQIDILNHTLVVYLLHGSTFINCAMVNDPINELTDTIEKLKESVGINMAHVSYEIK